MKRHSWLLAACLGATLVIGSGGQATAQGPVYFQPAPVIAVAPVPVVAVAPVPVEVVAYPGRRAWRYATGRAPVRVYYGPRRVYRGPRVVVAW